MAGFVEEDLAVSGSVYRSPNANIESNDGYCVYLYTQNLSGTVKITVYATAMPKADKTDLTKWASIHTATLNASSSYLLNVELSLYSHVFVLIDGTQDGGGSFNGGYLRLTSS